MHNGPQLAETHPTSQSLTHESGLHQQIPPICQVLFHLSNHLTPKTHHATSCFVRWSWAGLWLAGVSKLSLKAACGIPNSQNPLL